jgi:DNA-binding SARP family transcriptional activator
VRLAEVEGETGRIERAVVAVEWAIKTVDAYAEDLYVRGIQLHVEAGRIESAHELYRALGSCLNDLGADPSAATKDAVSEILESSKSRRVVTSVAPERQ